MATVTDTDLGYRAVLKSLGELGGVEVLAGPDTPELGQIAAFNDLGTDTIPERPFMRQTMDVHQVEYADMMGEAGGLVLDGVGVRVAYSVPGQKMVDDIQHAIVTWDSPPNAPSTVAKKGFDDPLVDTLALHDSIDFEVLS